MAVPKSISKFMEKGLKKSASKRDLLYLVSMHRGISGK